MSKHFDYRTTDNSQREVAPYLAKVVLGFAHDIQQGRGMLIQLLVAPAQEDQGALQMKRAYSICTGDPLFNGVLAEGLGSI